MTNIELVSLINSELKNVFRQQRRESALLYEPMGYMVSLGGKRLRPALLLLTHQLYNDDITKAMPAAVAMELFHNFTLIHDDIMDGAPLRRNHPSVHEKWNTSTAILSGDALLVLSYSHLIKCDKQILPEALGIFNHTAISVCEGQQMDMLFEKEKQVTVAQYIAMISLKTAALIAGCMRIGALIAGADKQDIKLLGGFGKNIGICFQLCDDMLDVYGDPEKFGKKQGGDITANKKTFLFAKALEIANVQEKKKLIEIYYKFNGSNGQKIISVKKIYARLGIRQVAQKTIRKYYDTALQFLNRLSIQQEKKNSLISYAEQLIERER